MTYKTLVGAKFADFRKFLFISMTYTLSGLSDFSPTQKDWNSKCWKFQKKRRLERLKLGPQTIPNHQRSPEILDHFIA